MSCEEGIVTRVADNRAWVRVTRSSMCEICKVKDSCSATSGETEAESLNAAGASVGDRVIISITPRSLLRVACLFYLVPTAGLLAGALAGGSLAQRWDMDPESASVLLAAGSFAIAFIIVNIIGTLIKKNVSHLPVITKIVSRAQGNRNEDYIKD